MTVKKNYDSIILIPYRNRESHLKYFLDNTLPIFNQLLPNNKIVILHQANDKLFNRGKLLNVGFKEYLDKTQYFITHDVDVNPFHDTVKNLYTDNIKSKIKGIFTSQHNTLGGVVKISSDNISKMNGFPNGCWGWGGEDKALQNRAEFNNIEIEKNILSCDNCYHDSFFRFEDIDDREKKDEMLRYETNFINFSKLSNQEKKKKIDTDGLDTLKYNITDKLEFDNIEVINIEI